MLRTPEYAFTVFVHAGVAYEYKGSDVEMALRVFSAVTRDKAPTHDTAQAFVVNRPYMDYMKVANTEERCWFVTQLERKDGVWAASTTKEWKHTLDVLRRDDDHDLVVPAAKEQVVENLQAKAVRGGGISWGPLVMTQELAPIWDEWAKNYIDDAGKRFAAWLETDEAKAALEKRRAEEAAKFVASPWGGEVTVIGEKRKRDGEEPERTS
jgi:hypothetical protein